MKTLTRWKALRELFHKKKEIERWMGDSEYITKESLKAFLVRKKNEDKG
jgi:hypothetical protein